MQYCVVCSATSALHPRLPSPRLQRTLAIFRVLVWTASLQVCPTYGDAQTGVGSCAGIPTSVKGFPTWLHVRTRLAVAVHGEEPLRAGDELRRFAALAAMAVATCRLGPIAARLALQHEQMLTQLETAMPIVLNISHSLHKDWSRIVSMDFATILHSGWPIFELLRQIQELIINITTRHADTPFRSHMMGTTESVCDKSNSAADIRWLDAFPRDAQFLPGDGLGRLDVYDFSHMLNSDASEVCPLALASHYLVIATAVLRNPNISVAFADDGKEKDWREHFSSHDFFVHKSTAYVAILSFMDVMLSRWPVLIILAQIAGTRIMYGPGLSYWRPFLYGGGPPAILEAGAHDGGDTMHYAKAFPEAHIWAFEAHPSVYRKLAKTMRSCAAHCSRVRTMHCALGSEDRKTVPFFANPTATSKESDWGTDSSSSLFRPRGNGSRFSQYHVKPQSVQMRRLETVALEVGMERLRIMELDAEGGELDILRGAGGKLLQSVRLMKLEIRRSAETSHYMDVPLWPEVRRWLLEKGFVLLLELQNDALFVRRDLAALP